MNKFAVIYLIFCTFFLVYADNTPKNLKPSQNNKSEKKVIWIDNNKILKNFTDGLVKLYESKEMVKMITIIKQLDRKKCDLPLSGIQNTGDVLTPENLFQKCKNSVVVVGTLKPKKGYKWQVTISSGFFLTKTGIIAVAYHAVNQLNHLGIGVMTSNGEIFPVLEVLAADKEHDIAIIRINGDKQEFQPIPLTKQAAVGAPVWIIGHPGRQFYYFSNGMVAGYHINEQHGHKKYSLYVTADYGIGSSGAPILNKFGDAIGFASTTGAVFYKQRSRSGYPQMIMKSGISSKWIMELFRR